jgi:acetyl-CoA carboxylase biotin carboxyl carrier protein
MNLKEIREIIDLITEKGISEFELERAGVRIKISRGGAVRSVEIPGQSVGAAPSAGAGARSTLPLASAIPPPMAAAAPASSLEELFVVRSPMVGTFYSAPGQDTPPFVEVGERVQVGQILCIIEAMKLMNEIEAEVEGEMVKCYIENGQPVEFGEPLFDIRPTASAKKRV